MKITVARPIVRQFAADQTKKAITHLRRGGHVVLWDGPKRAHFVVPYFEEADKGNLGLWAILDLYKLRYDILSDGPLRGFIQTLIPRDCLGIARRRAIRDEAHEGATRTIRLDCLECGACCNGPVVTLEPADLERFAAAGRTELARRPYARRKNGKVVLVLNDQGRCRHHPRNHRCAIYDIRPNDCRVFPVGCEGCLAARGEELGLWDGKNPLL